MPVSATPRPLYLFPHSRSITGVSVTRPRPTQTQLANTATSMDPPDTAIPTAAKLWNKKTLDALGVTFARDPDSLVDFDFTSSRPADPRQMANRMPMPQSLETRCSPLPASADRSR